MARSRIAGRSTWLAIPALATLVGCASSAATPPAEVVVPPVAGADAASAPADKKAECRAMLETVEHGVQVRTRPSVRTGDPTGITALRHSAEDMDRLAAEAKALTIRDRDVARMRAEYQEMATGLAAATRAVVEAALAEDQAGLDAARKARQAAEDREGPIVGKLDALCHE